MYKYCSSTRARSTCKSNSYSCSMGTNVHTAGVRRASAGITRITGSRTAFRRPGWHHLWGSEKPGPARRLFYSRLASPSPASSFLFCCRRREEFSGEPTTQSHSVLLLMGLTTLLPSAFFLDLVRAEQRTISHPRCPDRCTGGHPRCPGYVARTGLYTGCVRVT